MKKYYQWAAIISVFVFYGCTQEDTDEKNTASAAETKMEETWPVVGGPIPSLQDDLRFAVIGDLTGGYRDGVFETAVDTINTLDVDFVISIGDVIEGLIYSREAIEAEWDEFELMAAELNAPLVITPGNHDIFSGLSKSIWEERLGDSFFAFRRSDFLFIVLNTEDLSDSDLELGLEDMRRRIDVLTDNSAESYQKAQKSRNDLKRRILFADENFRYFEGRAEDLLEETEQVWSEGGIPMSPNSESTAFTDAQLEFVQDTLDQNPDVKWTFVFLHKPVWIGAGTNGFHQLQASLSDRPFTMFAGHLHRYAHQIIDGRDYITMGVTGGGATNDIEGEIINGSYDHITLVTTNAEEPKITNFLLDGVYDETGLRVADKHDAIVHGAP